MSEDQHMTLASESFSTAGPERDHCTSSNQDLTAQVEITESWLVNLVMTVPTVLDPCFEARGVLKDLTNNTMVGRKRLLKKRLGSSEQAIKVIGVIITHAVEIKKLFKTKASLEIAKKAAKAKQATAKDAPKLQQPKVLVLSSTTTNNENENDNDIATHHSSSLAFDMSKLGKTFSPSTKVLVDTSNDSVSVKSTKRILAVASTDNVSAKSNVATITKEHEAANEQKRSRLSIGEKSPGKPAAKVPKVCHDTGIEPTMMEIAVNANHSLKDDDDILPLTLENKRRQQCIADSSLPSRPSNKKLKVLATEKDTKSINTNNTCRLSHLLNKTSSSLLQQAPIKEQETCQAVLEKLAIALLEEKKVQCRPYTIKERSLITMAMRYKLIDYIVQLHDLFHLPVLYSHVSSELFVKYRILLE